MLSLKKNAKPSGLFGFKCYLNDGVKQNERIFFIKIKPIAPAADDFTVTNGLSVDPAVISVNYIQGRRHFIKSSSPARLCSLLQYSPRFGILLWKDKSARVSGNLTLVALEENSNARTEKVIFIEGSTDLAPVIIPPPLPPFQTKKKDQNPITLYLQLNVSESEDIGNIVGQLNLTEGSHFDGLLENALIINSIGEIIVNKLLDFEEAEKFIITFYEKDLRRPSWFTKVEVSFNIVDVNDEPPVISGMPELLAIDETQVGQVVVSLTVEDKDTENPFFLRWIFSTPFELSDCFSISDSGELVLEKYPENIFSGEIRVVASDNYKETISTVQVLVGKQKPSFVGRTGRSCEIAEYSATISEGAKIGAKVISIPRKFKILDASDGYKDFFRSSRGNLYLRKQLDFEKIEKLSLLLEMTGEKCQVIVTVSIEDLNDETPRFLRKFSFNATKEVGSVVGVVKAFDADKNDVLSYSTDSKFIKISEDGKIELVELPISKEITAILTASDGLHATTTDLTINFQDSSFKMQTNLSSWADMNDSELYEFPEGGKIFVDHELFYASGRILKYNEEYVRISGKFDLPIINLESRQNSTLQIVMCRKKEPVNFKISFSSTPVKLFTLNSCKNYSSLASLPNFLELNGNDLFLNISTIFFQKTVGKQFTADFVCLKSAEIQPMTFDLVAGYFRKLEFEKERYIFQGNSGKVKLLPSQYQFGFSTDDDVVSIADSGDLTLKSFRDGERISVTVKASSLTYPVVTASTTVTFISNSTRTTVIECDDFCAATDDYIFKGDTKLERSLNGSIRVKPAFSTTKIIIDKGCLGSKCSIFAISKSSVGEKSDKQAMKKLVLTEDSKFIELLDGTVRLRDSSVKKSIEAFVFEDKEPVKINSILLLPACGSECSPVEISKPFELRCKTKELDVISPDNCQIKKPEQEPPPEFPLQLLGGAVGVTTASTRIRRVDFALESFDNAERVILSSFDSFGKLKFVLCMDQCGFKMYQNNRKVESIGCEPQKIRSFSISFEDKTKITSAGRILLEASPEQPFQMYLGGGLNGPIVVDGRLIQPFFGKFHKLHFYPKNKVEFIDLDDIPRSVRSEFIVGCQNDLTFDRLFCSQSSRKSFGTAGFLISFLLATIFAVLLLLFLTKIFPLFSFKPVEKKSNSLATLPQPMTPMGNNNEIKTARITQETPIMNDARSSCSLSVSNRHEYLSAVSSNSLPRPPNIVISEEDKRELIL